jgi:hypothetical protein
MPRHPGKANYYFPPGLGGGQVPNRIFAEDTIHPRDNEDYACKEVDSYGRFSAIKKVLPKLKYCSESFYISLPAF